MTTASWIANDHDRIVRALPELAAGRLSEHRAREIESHLDVCRACRARLEAHRLFGRIVDRASDESDHHPDSTVLALCAVRPEEVLEVDRVELRMHLDRCAACRSEMELLADALAAARPGQATRSVVPAVINSLSRVATGTAAKLAAALGGAAIALVTLYIALLAGSDSPSSAGVASAPPAADGTEIELSHLELDDSQVIEANHRLTVSHVKVKPGAQITFRAGEVAAFGDGFSISSGGAVAVESGGSRSREPRRAGS